MEDKTKSALKAMAYASITIIPLKAEIFWPHNKKRDSPDKINANNEKYAILSRFSFGTNGSQTKIMHAAIPKIISGKMAKRELTGTGVGMGLFVSPRGCKRNSTCRR